MYRATTEVTIDRNQLTAVKETKLQLHLFIFSLHSF